MPDENTLALRRQVSRRAQLVRQRTRLKNEVHAVLAAHLIERWPATDLFGKTGRVWLGAQPLPMDERLGVEQRLRELDRLGEDLREMDRAWAQVSISDERLRRCTLMPSPAIVTTCRSFLRRATNVSLSAGLTSPYTSSIPRRAATAVASPSPVAVTIRSSAACLRPPRRSRRRADPRSMYRSCQRSACLACAGFQ